MSKDSQGSGEAGNHEMSTDANIGLAAAVRVDALDARIGRPKSLSSLPRFPVEVELVSEGAQ
jgi:hypothetical protein